MGLKDQVPELGLQPSFTFPEITKVVVVASIVRFTLELWLIPAPDKIFRKSLTEFVYVPFPLK